MKLKARKIKEYSLKILTSSWFITLFSTTAGVLLAFYLNGVGEKINLKKQKKRALEYLIMEIEENKKDLASPDINDSLLIYLDKTLKLVGDDLSDELVTTPIIMSRLLNEVPIIEVEDSTAYKEGKYQYEIDIRLTININEMGSIAWEAAKMSNVSSELSYQCLSELIGVYSLQQLFMNEEKKLIELTKNDDYAKTRATLNILNGLKPQVLEEYDDALEVLKEEMKKI